jgi:hypothetical protein
LLPIKRKARKRQQYKGLQLTSDRSFP